MNIMLLDMVIFAVKIDVIPQKYLEFMQTAADMIDCIRSDKGYISAKLYQDIKNEYSLFILTEWETAEDLNRHMKSNHFKILQWTLTEMTHSSMMNLNQVAECKNLYR